MGDSETEELRVRELMRERQEREAARESPDEREADQHAARADKAGYLRKRLEERARAERESE